MRLKARFLGMFGPQGALPLTTTDEAHGWLLERDDAFARFVDIFQRRFLALFFRAWADARPIAQHDRPDEDRFRAYIGAMIGIGTPAFRDADSISDFAKLPYAGSARPAGQERVASARVSRQLSRDARRDRGIRRQLARARSKRAHASRGGQQPPRPGLRRGREHVHASATSFAFASSCATSSISGSSCPARRSREQIADAVYLYLGLEYDWDMELAIPAGQITPVRLGRDAQVGWTSWMSPNWAKTDETFRRDARFHVVSRLAKRDVEGRCPWARTSASKRSPASSTASATKSFLQGLRQAKSAGNRNLELAHWLHAYPAEGPHRSRAHRRSFQARPREAARRRDRRGQRLPQERNRDARHLESGRRRSRPRLALCDAAVRRDADPHRASARRDPEVGRAEARADRRVAGIRQDSRR